MKYSDKQSKGAKKIEAILKKAHVEYEKEYSFNDLKGKSGVLYRFDFCLYINGSYPKVLIEYDGEAHFKHILHFANTTNKYKQACERDRTKNKYCLMHNIPLFRIPYWEIDKITCMAEIFTPKHRVKNKFHNDYLSPPT